MSQDRTPTRLTGLYISPKTADHVSVVLTKLGVPSRRTIVVRAEELGL
jgi:hypothetical protein